MPTQKPSEQYKQLIKWKLKMLKKHMEMNDRIHEMLKRVFPLDEAQEEENDR